MNSEKPNNNRRLVIIAAVVALVACLVTALALAATSGGDDDRSGTATKPPAASQAAEPRPLVLMVKHGEQHALLDLLFHPQGGQVTGKYTLVHFDPEGNPLRYPDAKAIGGYGTESGFTLDGLGDYGPVKGNVLDGGTRVHFDQTFGVEEYDWKVITSNKGLFDQKVDEFESCSKKHDTTYCEGVS